MLGSTSSKEAREGRREEEIMTLPSLESTWQESQLMQAFLWALHECCDTCKLTKYKPHIHKTSNRNIRTSNFIC